MVAEDMRFLYSKYIDSIILNASAAKNYYGWVCYEKLKLSIRSEADYSHIHLQIYLVKENGYL